MLKGAVVYKDHVNSLYISQTDVKMSRTTCFRLDCFQEVLF